MRDSSGRLSAAPARPLFSLFPHERGPAEPFRTIASGELREWPALWASDPRLLSLFGGEARELVRRDPGRLRYFAAADPTYPGVPLLDADSVAALRLSPGAGIRDKLWQRLVVEGAGHLPQPGFAAVNGGRVEASNAPWLARVTALDCRPARAALLAAAGPGVVVVVEGADAGFVAVAGGDGVRLTTRSPHVAARLKGPIDRPFSPTRWAELVHDLCAEALPFGATKAAFNPAADLADALRHAPGSYILKPRLGSNGFCVARVVGHADGTLAVESDCPDTAQYLEDFPHDPALRGRDLVAAVATHRSRFVDRARVGLPEHALDQSILEGEIRQDRTEGSLFDPRVVVQRVKDGAGERFATLGAICKRIDTAVGASVVRDFREEPLEASLRRFLGPRVPGIDLGRQVRLARDELLAAADQLRAVLVPLVEASGARAHQFVIDCRLCWDAAAGRAEFPFLEFQFGIGRIDWPTLGSAAFAGYQTREELRGHFGAEVG